MEPEAPGGTEGPPAPPPPGSSWQPGIPSVREHLPSLIFGAALPIGVYFIVRRHVRHRHPGADHRRLLLRGLDRPAVHPPAQGRRRRGRRPGGLRHRGDHLHAARWQRVHAQGPRRLLHLALRRRLHRHALHARPPRALLREPLPLRRQGPRQGLRLRPAARAAERSPHLPPLVGRLGHRARRWRPRPASPWPTSCPPGPSSPSPRSSPPPSSAASSPSPWPT